MTKKRVTIVIEYENSNPVVYAGMDANDLSYEFDYGENEVVSFAFYDALQDDELDYTSLKTDRMLE